MVFFLRVADSRIFFHRCTWVRDSTGEVFSARNVTSPVDDAHRTVVQCRFLQLLLQDVNNNCVTN